RVFFNLTNPKTSRDTFSLRGNKRRRRCELRRSYEHNSVNYSYSSANWSAACLAVQPRLGLLSQRWTRSDSFDFNHPRATGRHLSRIAGCAERIRVPRREKSPRPVKI